MIDQLSPLFEKLNPFEGKNNLYFSQEKTLKHLKNQTMSLNDLKDIKDQMSQFLKDETVPVANIKKTHLMNNTSFDGHFMSMSNLAISSNDKKINPPKKASWMDVEKTCSLSDKQRIITYNRMVSTILMLLPKED